MVDPIQPDISSPGRPDVGELTINTASEGGIIPEVLGTVKLGGNIVWHSGEPRAVDVKEKQESGGKGGGGGGGGGEYVTGYKYYLTWCLEICMGPVDKIYTIIENDEIVWASNSGLDRPVSGGKETITVDSNRSIDFYFGTDDQVPSSFLAGLSNGPTWNIPRRHRCWMLFKDYYIGEYPRCPNIQVVLEKTPVIAAMNEDHREIWGFDYNPMFAKHYIIEEMAGIDVSDLIDYTSWDADAQTLFYEGRGVSILFDEQQTVRDWLEQIDQHIFAGLRYGADGKFESKLLRGAEAPSTMLSLNDEAHCLETPQFSRQTWLGVINELKVQHPLRTFEETCTPEECMIIGSTHQLDLGESINLEAICSSGDPDKCNFSWDVSEASGGSGGGSLSTNIGNATTYTAPMTNYACVPAVIKLYGNGKLVYTWSSITTDYDNGKVAYLQCNAGDYSCIPFWGYWPSNMECPDNKCCCWCTYRGYDCKGILVPTYSHGWPAGYRNPDGGDAAVCGNNTPPYSATCDGSSCVDWVDDRMDWRGVCGADCADLNESCCPEDLIFGL